MNNSLTSSVVAIMSSAATVMSSSHSGEFLAFPYHNET